MGHYPVHETLLTVFQPKRGVLLVNLAASVVDRVLRLSADLFYCLWDTFRTVVAIEVACQLDLTSGASYRGERPEIEACIQINVLH